MIALKNRTDEIWETLSSFVKERAVLDIERVMAHFNEHAARLIADLQAALRLCDERAAEMRRRGEKGETAYISFSFLDTSILTGAFDLRIDFYDENFIADIAEACAYMPYHYLVPFYEESAGLLGEKAKSQNLRFMDYEYDALALRYKDEVLYNMVLTLCSILLLHADMEGFYPELDVAENCVFTFGRLLQDQQLYLKYPKRKGAAV